MGPQFFGFEVRKVDTPKLLLIAIMPNYYY